MRLTIDKVRQGMLVKRVVPGSDITVGKVYKVLGIKGTGSIMIINDIDCRHYYDVGKFIEGLEYKPFKSNLP